MRFRSPLLLLLVLPRSAAAEAGLPPLDVAVGFREVTTSQYDGTPFGLHLAGRAWLADRVAVEGGLYGRVPGNGVSGLTKTLLAISYEGDPDSTFVVPVNHEAATLDLLVEGSPWARKREPGVSIWPYLMAGASFGVVSENYAALSPDYDGDEEAGAVAVMGPDPTLGLSWGPTGGAGFDVWFGKRAGMRVVGAERLSIETEPDYGNIDATGEAEQLGKRLTAHAFFSIDLIVALP